MTHAAHSKQIREKSNGFSPLSATNVPAAAIPIAPSSSVAVSAATVPQPVMPTSEVASDSAPINPTTSFGAANLNVNAIDLGKSETGIARAGSTPAAYLCGS